MKEIRDELTEWRKKGVKKKKEYKELCKKK